MNKVTAKKFLKKYSPVLGILFAVAISVLVFVFRDKFVSLQNYGYLGLFTLSILGNATIILPVPIILTAFIGGAVFNPLIVGVVVSLGATIGELTGYLAGAGGGEIVEKDVRVQKIKKWMDKYGLWTLFVLAVIPNPLFDLAGIVAGATKIPVYKYFIVVWLGKLIKFVAISYLGAGSINLIDRFV
ncbi:MAG: VTT domain-containing protein [Candidatus Woesebacteria bacterium]|nr:VTT domain-containing protein [Candidatus Woesebacteria bacterium]